MMQRALAIVALLAAFLILNRGAFEGFFSDDDLDNLSWATVAGMDSFVRELATPVFSKTNTRPTGGLFYRWAGQAFGFDFEKYLVPLFALHWLNGALLFALLRKKGHGEIEAAATTIFFLFHAALLEAWWKPMYIFDLLAATFCLLTWLLYSTRFWPAALATFWLAYKSKEVALFFPVVLALDQAKRAIPFLLISASFGLQAMQVNTQRDTVYTLRFTPASLIKTIPFYFKQAILNKFGALTLAPLLWFARQPEFLKALLGTAALMIPLLFLPGRLFSVYLYVPLLALMPGLAALLKQATRRLLFAGLGLFLLLDYLTLKEKRKTEIAMGHEARHYVTQLRQAHQQTPLPSTAYLENAPIGYKLHGLVGALRLITKDPKARVLNPEVESARLEAKDHPLPTLLWFAPTQTLSIVPHQFGEAKLSELDFINPSAGWQLTSGWFDRENHFRWAARTAKLRLLAQPDQTKLRIRYNNSPLVMQALGKIEVTVLVNGQPLGTSQFTTAGTPAVDYPIAQAFNGPIDVELRSSPGFIPPGDDRELGVAVLSIGLIR